MSALDDELINMVKALRAENARLQKAVEEAHKMMSSVNCIEDYYIDHPAIARWLKEYGKG